MSSLEFDRSRFDAGIFALIPHRSPMLLINSIQSLSASDSSAIVIVDEQAPFYQSQGIPSWIGLEYMGQTAALIAGYQLQQGLVSPHLGLLLGTRKYQSDVDFFSAPNKLLISCKQAALVGESLANFDCIIQDQSSQQEIARASLSVFRKPQNSSAANMS